MSIAQLKSAHEASKPIQTKPFRKLSPEDLHGKKFPVTAYETAYSYIDDELVSGAVRQIEIIEYGLALGANTPSVLCRSDTEKWRGSVDMYFPTAEDARNEIDNIIGQHNAENAMAEFVDLAWLKMPALLEAADKIMMLCNDAPALAQRLGLIRIAENLNKTPLRQEIIQQKLNQMGYRIECSQSAFDGTSHAIVEIASGECVDPPNDEIRELAEEWSILEGAEE